MSTSASFLLPAFSPPTGTAPGLVYQPDHASEAESRLLAQFDDSAKLHALVRALVSPLQQLEQDAFGVIAAFDLATVQGAQLDAVGGLVGEARQGRADAHFRAYVQARVLSNSADGTASTLYQIARTLLGDNALTLRLVPLPPAHYDFEVAASALQLPWDDALSVSPEQVARTLADCLFLATSLGVSLTLFYQYTPDADTFLFASAGDAEEDDVARGLSDVDDEGAGGALIGAENRS
jgi:hypothetical protein